MIRHHAKTISKIIEDAHQLLNKELIDKAFAELNQDISNSNKHYEIVVGGGTPLIYNELVDRELTHDVDSVSANEIMHLKSSIYRIADLFNFDDEWLNAQLLGRYPFNKIYKGELLFNGSHLKVYSLPYVCIIILKLSIRSQDTGSLRMHDISDIQSAIRKLGFSRNDFEEEMKIYFKDISDQETVKTILGNYEKYKIHLWKA